MIAWEMWGEIPGYLPLDGHCVGVGMNVLVKECK